MAVCNIFNKLNNPAGNFMMFSQYVEDITKNYVQGDEYKVVPSKYVALNIDYTKLLNNSDVSNDTQNTDLNEIIPNFYQNKFENGCAYIRGRETPVWNSTLSKNLFWNTLYDYQLITHQTHKTDIEFVNEIVTYGTINIHAYDTHNDMGYGEIYCYIPAGAEKQICEVVPMIENRGSVINYGNHLEGFENIPLEGKNTYYYTSDYSMSFEDNQLCQAVDNTVTQYDINTIVVLYDVQQKINDEWWPLYSNIPMGVYITGQYVDGVCTNTIKKYVSTDYGVGTSYGFRVCTRFSVNPNGVILTENELNVDADNYTSLTQLMCSMSESIDKMNDIMQSTKDQENIYKTGLQEIKNNRTNVPYVKAINGRLYWFINGRVVGDIPDFNRVEEVAAELESVKEDINTIFQGLNNCTPITYYELVLLRNAKRFKPGTYYQIVDYVTTTTQENTQVPEQPNLFDVIVLALSEDTLAEKAYVTQSKRDVDGYFSENKLSKWEIKYSLDNDRNRFAWSDTEYGKGVIYYMKDEWGNECPYDFKNIKFKKSNSSDTNYYYTFTNIINGDISDKSIIKGYCYDNVIKGFVNDNKLKLNGNVFINTSNSKCYSNAFGCDCHSISLGDGCYNNTFGNGCYSNNFGDNCHSNTFGSDCSSNTFGRDCHSNTFGNECYYNTFDNSCNGNIFGNECYYNTFDNSCNGNIFGNECYSNKFGNNCKKNSFSNSCYENRFGNGSYGNSFKNNCHDNSFGNSCNGNSFGNSCYSNTFGDSCQNNSFGNSCYSNDFGNNFQNNSFGDKCYENRFGNGSYGNSFKNNCHDNSFGTGCGYNSFGNSCKFICFGKSTDNIKSYYRYIIFDDGNSYINLNCTTTTSSSNYYQNVRIGLGVNNKSTYKTINDSRVNQSYETLYKPANSQTISI